MIDRLAQDLRREFPDLKGFSARNLKYMRAFAEAYPDKEFLQQVAAQIYEKNIWYDTILSKLISGQIRIKDAEKFVLWRNIICLESI